MAAMMTETPDGLQRPARCLALRLSLVLAAVAAMGAGCATAKMSTFAHPPVSGSLGPFATARVELRYADPVTANGFTGQVNAGGLQYLLPEPDEPTEFFDVKVNAAMFVNADRKPGNELLVLYRAHKIAPSSPGYDAVAVYGWTGRDFVRLRDIEQALEGSANAAEVRRRLARKGAK